MTPTLPTSGNPVKSTFSCTPTNSELGTNVINFSVTDPTGTQIFTSVTVEVTLRPSFAGNTPGDGSTFYVKPGDMIEEMISAEDPDPKDIVTLSVANLPKNASFPIPPAGNPVKSTFSWTPVASDWGTYEIIFTAEYSFKDKANLSLFYSVNQEPVFSSNPVAEAIVGQPYEYKIEVDDPDIQYGDMIKLIEEVDPLPAWLSLDYTPGKEMATLKGTPQKGDIGTPYDDMPGINSGAAYVYEYDGSTWSESMKLKPDDIRTGDYFGWSASISGENTMIGAYTSDKKGKESGSACIYNLAVGSDMLARTVSKTDEKLTDQAIEGESKAFEEQEPVIISAYPNPVIEKLNLQFNKSVEKPVSFSLYDQLGRLIYSKNEIVIDNPQTIELNLSELKVTPGLLFLSIHADGEKERTVRLLKR